MKMVESKNISQTAINQAANIAADAITIEDCYSMLNAWAEKFNGYYWIYRGGSHVALMEKNPITGESDRIAMFL